MRFNARKRGMNIKRRKLIVLHQCSASAIFKLVNGHLTQLKHAIILDLAAQLDADGLGTRIIAAPWKILAGVGFDLFEQIGRHTK